MSAPIFVDRLFYIYSQLLAYKSIDLSMRAPDQAHSYREPAQRPTEFYTKARLHHAIHVVVSLVFAGLHVLKALTEALEAGVALKGRDVLIALRIGGTKLGYEAGIIAIHVAGIFAPVWVQVKTKSAIQKIMGRHKEVEGSESTEDNYHFISTGSPASDSVEVREVAISNCVEFVPLRDYML